MSCYMEKSAAIVTVKKLFDRNSGRVHGPQRYEASLQLKTGKCPLSQAHPNSRASNRVEAID